MKKFAYFLAVFAQILAIGGCAAMATEVQILKEETWK